MQVGGEVMGFLGGIIDRLNKKKKNQIQTVPQSFILTVMLNMFLIKNEHQVIIYLPYLSYVYI